MSDDDKMNRAIRQALAPGSAPASETAPETETEAASEASDLDRVKAIAAIAAAEAGLGLSAGRWLRGSTVEELQADAAKFAAEGARYRAKQGQPGLGFDGGARGTSASVGPPSMDSMIRAEVEARRTDIRDRAVQLDRDNKGRR
jgi:hypothetical protein